MSNNEQPRFKTVSRITEIHNTITYPKGVMRLEGKHKAGELQETQKESAMKGKTVKGLALNLAGRAISSAIKLGYHALYSEVKPPSARRRSYSPR